MAISNITKQLYTLAIQKNSNKLYTFIDIFNCLLKQSNRLIYYYPLQYADNKLNQKNFSQNKFKTVGTSQNRYILQYQSKAHKINFSKNNNNSSYIPLTIRH